MDFLKKKKKNVWRFAGPLLYIKCVKIVKPFSKIGENSQIKELFIEDLLGGRHLNPFTSHSGHVSEALMCPAYRWGNRGLRW